MTYIKLLTVLAGLALLTACGGSSPTTPASNNTGGDNSGGDNSGGDNSGGDNSGGNNNGGGGGNPTDCTQTPFHNDCLTNNAPALALRESMCLANIQIDDSCRGDRGIATLFCKDDPFNTATACMADAYNDERLMVCMGESTSTRCDTTINPICELDFNNALCRGRAKYDEQLRCADGACVVNTADWLASPAVTVLGTAPASTHTANGFLSGLTDTQPEVEGFTLGAVLSFGNSLTLADNGLGGDANDGASFFFGNFNQGERFYAGIHASTDLGAPLDNISQAGIWTGWIRWNGGFRLNRRFDLTVTFDTASQGGTIAASFSSGNILYDIDGTFNDKGVITTGNFIFGTSNDGMTIADNDERTPGILTGLIGQEGVVAAFISTTNTRTIDGGRNPYSGAFVARPPVPDPEPLVINHGDWTRNFLPLLTTPSTTPINQFLAGTTTLDPLTSVTPTLLTNAIGGVGFFTENDRFYSGLLSNTSLGTPVAITPQVSDADVTAEWEGEIQGIGVFDSTGVDTTIAIDLDLTVNFTARTFTATRADPNASLTSITIDGNFPAKDNGLVTGTVTQTLEGVQFSRFGLLTGLIGADGVVGAFYSNSIVAGEAYVGGFYAAPSNN